MKIVHIYANNLAVFENVLEGTGCRVNGSTQLDYLFKSLPNFNARDVLGLIVFPPKMTKKTLRLIKYFDDLYSFAPLPVIVVVDNATELVSRGKIKTKFSPLFVVDSVEGTISDIDLRRIYTTLSCMSDDMYDLSDIDLMRPKKVLQKKEESVHTRGQLAEEVLRECARLGGITE